MPEERRHQIFPEPLTPEWLKLQVPGLIKDLKRWLKELPPEEAVKYREELKRLSEGDYN